VHFALNHPIYRNTFYPLIEMTMLLVHAVPSDWFILNYNEGNGEGGDQMIDIMDFKAQLIDKLLECHRIAIT
jgi:hypothetical protein